MRAVHSRRLFAATLLGLSVAPLTTLGQSIEVVPPASETVAASNLGNSIPLGASIGGTYQAIYMPSQLVGLPIGGQITSLQLRLYNGAGAPWPSSAGTITNYRISLGGSNLTADTLSTVFADNISSPVLVRSGSFSLDAGAYPGGAATGSTPEAWGPVIAFSTPYTYKGGPLVIEFRSTGIGGGTNFADATPSTSESKSVGSVASDAATTGSIGNSPIVMRLGITPPNTQSLTVPNANDTVAGTTGNLIPLAANVGGRHLTLYAADQLASIPPGSMIMGVQLRQRNAETTPWPATAFTASDYEIWLCQSSLTPATASTTFANNILNPVLVRDGARDFALNEFPGGGATGTTPEGWGPLMVFDTPYVYTGGVMGLEFRNTGGGPSPAHFADIISNGATAAGLGSTVSPTNPTGSLNGAIIARFAYVTPVESPFGDGVTKIYAAKQFADTEADNFFVGFTRNQNFTDQSLFGPEQFQTVGPGTLLTGVAFRNKLTTAWPPALAGYAQFDLRLSKSPLTPGSMSTTVASNSGADALTVRSGSLAVAAGSLAAKPATGTAAFTWEVPFSQPYPYRSGTLDMLINNQPIAVIDGQLDAVDGNNLPLQPLARSKYSFNVGSTTVPFQANVPVTRYSADAQVMVPNSLKDGVGFGSSFFFNSPLASDDSTFQVIIGASQLTYVPIGGLITSVSMMGNESSPSWPGATGAAADDLSIEVSSAANPPQSMSATFADNVGTDALMVRSGPISWTPDSLPAGSTGRFGATIAFDRAFIYRGGPICLTFRHSGVNNGNPSLRSANPATSVRVVRAAGKTATSGSFFSTSSGPAIQLGYIPAGTTPVSTIKTPANNQRDIFGSARAFQMLFDPAAVGVPVGATINGVTWRLRQNSATDFPVADLVFSRFDVWMSTSPNSAATASATFAANDGADLVQVLSGPLTIKPGSWSAASRGNREDWGAFIQFTRPFVYKGGTLALTLRNAAPTGASPSGLFECPSDADPVTTSQGVRTGLSPDATSGNFVKPPTTLFAFTDDAFCPWDLNNDGVVDDFDFQVFVLAYNILDCADAGMTLGCPSDFTFDGIVNDDDFLPFVQAYNAVLCP